jgi:hypothetical protein
VSSSRVLKQQGTTFLQAGDLATRYLSRLRTVRERNGLLSRSGNTSLRCGIGLVQFALDFGTSGSSSLRNVESLTTTFSGGSLTEFGSRSLMSQDSGLMAFLESRKPTVLSGT